MTNIAQGDTFTDIFGISPHALAFVSRSNQIYMQVPPRSFGVWVKGDKRSEQIEIQHYDDSPSNLSNFNEMPFTIYPNPADDVLQIGLRNLGKINVVVEITDIEGKVLLKQTILNPIRSIDVSSIAAGAYFLNVSVASNMHSKKVIIE